MSSNKKIVFVILLISIVILFLLGMGELPSGNENSDGRKLYNSTNWESRYGIDNKDPRGLSLFHTLLKAHLKKPKRVIEIADWKQYDSLIDPKKAATFLFIGHNFEMLNSEIDTILEAVNDGSDLFMSFYNLSENVYDRLFTHIEFNYDYSDSVIVYAGNKEVVLYNIFQTDTVAFEWEAFGEFTLKDTVYSTLSSFMEMANFLKIKHGKGYIYLHSNPEFFYNYQLLRADGFRHTNFFLEQMERKRNVYWLEVGGLETYQGVQDPNESNGPKQDDSYFKLLFKQPSLVLAMLLILLGFILYLIFRAKRMRPIVPYLEKKKNMTLSFADTITSIYFAKESPKGLLKVQRKNFYNTILKHFFVDLSRRDGDKEIRVLSEKSNVPFDELQEFIALLENKRANEVTQKYITEVAVKQRDFYLKTGVISNNLQLKIGRYEKRYTRALWIAGFFILIGIFAVLFSFKVLAEAKGLGVLLWPLGILFTAVGIAYLKKPIVVISNGQISFYGLFGKAKTFQLDEVLSVKISGSIIRFSFTENRNHSLNLWEISTNDKKLLMNYISTLHTIE